MYGCWDGYDDILEPDYRLNLIWNKAYEADTAEKSLTGLEWTLSYMGATLPKLDTGIVRIDSLFVIDLQKVGFSDKAVSNMLKLHETIRSSEEYQKTNTVDMGRYVSLLMGSPEHYYALVDMPEQVEDLLTDYDLGPYQGYVNNSGVSLEHRIIRYSNQSGFNQLFISAEVDSISGDTIEFETVDLLPNGQPRFGIFEADGRRRTHADPKHSRGGKPSKCMWCHESGIQPMFKEQMSMPEFLTYEQFQDTLWKFKRSHFALQKELTDGVDYAKTQQHTLTEILYIAFMEPSAERLSREWKLPLEEVQKRLSKLETHVHHEFPFLGQLYHRNEIEMYAPYTSVPVSGSIREPSETEVNYMTIHAKQ